MLASLNGKIPALINTSSDTTDLNFIQHHENCSYQTIENNESQEHQYHLVKYGQQDLYNKIVDYCIKNPTIPKKLEKIEAAYIESLPFKQRKKYKKRRWRGHSYGVRLILHVAYLLQAYHFAFGVEGKLINPSKATLAIQVGICIRTLDKALMILKAMGVVSWKSGKKTWETNTYYLADCYKTTPMRKPEDFKHPRYLWLKQQYLIAKQKLKEFTRTLYEHLSLDIADHLLRKNKFIRSSFEKRNKSSFKGSKDPPKVRKRSSSWYLLKPFKLSFKDQAILSRYSESCLRAAISDFRAYESWGKVINNKAAFLVSRCKQYKSQMKAKEKSATPTDIKSWLINYFKSNKSKFNFIGSKEELNLATSESKPFIDLKFHKEDFKKSVLKVFQKVHGTWVDKVFCFDRPDLVHAIENYLENSIKMA